MMEQASDFRIKQTIGTWDLISPIGSRCWRMRNIRLTMSFQSQSYFDDEDVYIVACAVRVDERPVRLLNDPSLETKRLMEPFCNGHPVASRREECVV
jgi:hypothetical protein